MVKLYKNKLSSSFLESYNSWQFYCKIITIRMGPIRIMQGSTCLILIEDNIHH